MDPFVNRMIGAARLNVSTYEEVEADPTATGQALGVVVIHSIASGIAAANQGFGSLILTTLFALLGWFVWALVIYFVGTKILPERTTSTSIGELLRTTGFAASPGALKVFGIIPILGILVVFAVSIWMLVAMVVAVRQALDYTETWRAVVVCIIGWLLYLPMAVIVALIN